MKYIIDLDGTLMDSAKPNLDSVDFIKELERRKQEFVIMTNSVKSPVAIKKRLDHVGIDVDLKNIINPIVAMNIYMERHDYNKAYVVGSNLEKEQVKLLVDGQEPDIVLLLDFEKDDISYKEIQKIYDYMKRGVPVVTASKSKFYLKDGDRQLDTGAFVSLLESVSGQNIEVIGKPSKDYFLSAIDLLDTDIEGVTVIGDDVNTDILGASEIGCKAILLKAGKYRQGDENKDYVTHSVDKLMDVFM